MDEEEKIYRQKVFKIGAISIGICLLIAYWYSTQGMAAECGYSKILGNCLSIGDLKIYNKDGFSDVADKDFEIILEELAKKYEREGFSKKYYPSKSGNKNYSKQSYKVIGRVKTEDEIQPQWNIIFDDGKIVTAKADEMISSAINERFYGEQVENFGKRPLSEVLISTDNEKLSLSEGQEKISAIINQLQRNGESVSNLQEMLKFEQKNLSYAR